jgi:hypothetical protein
MTNHKTRFSAIAVLAAAMLSGSIDDGVAANRSASEQELDTAKKTVVTPEEPKVRDEVEVATLENTEVQAILEQLLDPKAKPEALLPLLTDLGARGPDAEPTLDVLLDPAFYTAKVKRNPAMKKAVVDILVSIGRPSIDAVLNLKSEKAEQKQEARANTPRPETKEDSKSAKKQSNKIAALTKEMQEEANDLLRSMVLHGLGDEVIEEIERSLMPKKKLNGADWARLLWDQNRLLR